MRSIVGGGTVLPKDAHVLPPEPVIRFGYKGELGSLGS